MEANIKSRDIELIWVNPENVGELDERVPTAPELKANSRLSHKITQSTSAIALPAGVTIRPTFASAANRGVVIGSDLGFHAPGHPSLASLGGVVTTQLPALPDAVSTISRYDHLQLAVFGVVVTAEIDPDLIFEFEWGGQAGILQTRNKENTRRLRTAWMIVHSEGAPPDAAAIYAALTAPVTMGGPRTLTVSNSAAGLALLNNLQGYPLDPTLVNAQTYEVIEETIQVIPLCRVWRAQEHSQNGYIWGNGGEPLTFESDYHIQPTYKYVGEGWRDVDSRAIATLERIAKGLPIVNSPSYDRAVENLINGQVGANADAPGLATASPNGSVAIANDQRISFTNQGGVQRYYCLPVTAIDSGGFAQISVPFQSSPESYFSTNLEDHRVFNTNGRDISRDGAITGLGGTGALTWKANNAAIAAPGNVLYVQAGIYYPPGSGFQFAGEVEAVYKDAIAVTTSNVRDGALDQDIEAYTVPANGEDTIVVLGKERAALHYLYKRVTATTDSNGVLLIPPTARGVFAFINGVAGRVDSPVKTGLTGLTAYDALVYEPPRVGEAWQVQKKVARYAGTGESSFVDGAAIASSVFAFGNTQGGGNSVFLGSAELQYEPISFRLPANLTTAAIKSYQVENRVAFVGERDINAKSFRRIDLVPASGYTYPRPGQSLSLANAVDPQTRGQAVVLSVGGNPIGFTKNPIQFGYRYQVIIVFLLQKDGDQRMAIATFNEGNPNEARAIAFSSDAPHYMGFDIFHLY